MQSTDVILQVADETAEVMEEISEQLFDQTDARLKEVINALNELQSDYIERITKSDEQIDANQSEVMGKLRAISEALSDIKAESSGQAAELNEKSDRLIELSTELPQLLQSLSGQLSSEAEAHFDKFCNDLQALQSDYIEHTKKSDEQINSNQFEVMGRISAISEALSDIRENNNGQAAELNEKSDRLIALSTEIPQLLKAVSSDVAAVSDNCSSISEQLSTSAAALKENDDRLLANSEENIELVKKLSEQNDASVKELTGKIGEILACLDALSASVAAIAEQQNEICQRQNKIENDIKYLKLPFYKRWFRKG